MLRRQSRVRVFEKVNQQHSNLNPLQHLLIVEQENKTTEPNPKTRLSREDRRKAAPHNNGKSIPAKPAGTRNLDESKNRCEIQ